MKNFYLTPFIILTTWLLVVIVYSFISISPDYIQLDKILSKPGLSHWFGYDDLGRDIGTRIVLGVRTSIVVALIVVSISFCIGTTLGIISAWFGGIYDKAFILIVDLFMAFPGILLAIALAGILGPGIFNAVIALSLMGWVGFARLARVQTLSIKNRDHVIAARALGTPTLAILIKHVLPLIMAPLIVEASFALAGVMIAEAGLSFLGLGVQPPTASLGSMIRDGTQYMLVAPHVVLGPCFAILTLVISINMLGDLLRDKMDVKDNITVPGKTR